MKWKNSDTQLENLSAEDRISLMFGDVKNLISGACEKAVGLSQNKKIVDAILYFLEESQSIVATFTLGMCLIALNEVELTAEQRELLQKIIDDIIKAASSAGVSIQGGDLFDADQKMVN